MKALNWTKLLVMFLAVLLPQMSHAKVDELYFDSPFLIDDKIKPGKYILIDENDSKVAFQLLLKRNGKGRFKVRDSVQFTLQYDRDTLVLNFVSPLVLSRFESGPNESGRVQAVRLELKKSHNDTFSVILLNQAVDDVSGEVLESFSESFNMKLSLKNELPEWDLVLLNKQWILDGIDLITDADTPYSAGLSVAKTRFFEDGTGEFTFYNGSTSIFQWFVKKNRLILKTQRNGRSTKYVIWISKHIANLGIEFVANVVSNEEIQWQTRRGYMLEQQEQVFSQDRIVGSWAIGPIQYDHYADNITVPNIAFPASHWALSGNGIFSRVKLVHPEFGTVLNCPDDRCYISCEFKHRLIAVDGDLLYIENSTLSEVEPMGPLKLQGVEITRVKRSDEHGIDRFSSVWLNYARLTLNEEGTESLLSFYQQANSDGTVTGKVFINSPENVLGSYQIEDGKLLIISETESRVYEVLSFARSGITACSRLQGESCAEGHIVLFTFNNGI